MKNWLYSNSLKLIVFVKLHTHILLKPIDCLSLKIPSRMCSVAAEGPLLNVGDPLEKCLELPKAVKGAKKLDVKAFDKQVSLPAIFIHLGDSFVNVIKILKPFMLKMMAFRNVVDIVDDKLGTTKAIILDPSISSFNSFDESVVNKLKEQNVTEKEFHYIERTITFDNWYVEDIIKAVLPDGLKFSGYSIVGHIAHFNLRDELLDFKYILGEIVLGKVKIVKTVVNKIHIIENTYRNFQMELICGENNMLTKLKENGCSYELDFSKVYWNSRLGTEHGRVVSIMKKGDVLYDVFAGIGPFVVPAAKKGCTVVANDLNPDAYKWLVHNVKLNKVGSNVQCYNCDAQNFISIHMKNHLLRVIDQKGTDQFKVHVTMNLPASAVTFINDFHGLFSEDELKCIPKGIICHLYCFIKDDKIEKCNDKDVSELAKEFVETHLGRKLNDSLLEVLYVRKVAPTKAMFRVSFLFEPDFLVRRGTKRSNENEELTNSNKK